MPSSATAEAAIAALKTDESKILGVTIGIHNITPGLFIPKAESQAIPKLTYTGTGTGTFLALCVDLDAPFPSFPFLGPILHWIQPGLKASDSSGALTSLEAHIVSYIPPGPPPGSGPHRYVYLLYKEPEGIQGKKLAIAPAEGQEMARSARMRFDLEAFEKEAGLGPVVAANYFNTNR